MKEFSQLVNSTWSYCKNLTPRFLDTMYYSGIFGRSLSVLTACPLLLIWDRSAYILFSMCKLLVVMVLCWCYEVLLLYLHVAWSFTANGWITSSAGSLHNITAVWRNCVHRTRAWPCDRASWSRDGGTEAATRSTDSWWASDAAALCVQQRNLAAEALAAGPAAGNLSHFVWLV